MAKKRSFLKIGLAGGVLALLLGLGLIFAASETFPRHLASSGGGVVSQGNFHLHSAIGQPVAGSVENNLVLCSGYLCGADTLVDEPTPDEPLIYYLPIVLRTPYWVR